jgi:hypothetical protein
VPAGWTDAAAMRGASMTNQRYTFPTGPLYSFPSMV